MAEKEQPKLSEALKDKFKLAPGHPAGEYHFRGSKIDLSTIDLETAENLVKKGFDVLIPVKDAKPAPTGK